MTADDGSLHLVKVPETGWTVGGQNDELTQNTNYPTDAALQTSTWNCIVQRAFTYTPPVSSDVIHM